LVITGKGDPASPGSGVLRVRFRDWLAEDALRVRIARASEAHRRHGGAGAFYVFLKGGGR
jgi:DNA-nicking Smr family endonuclease